MEKILDKIVDGGINIGIKLIIAIIILVIGYKVIKVLIKLLQKSKGFNKLNKSVETFLISAIQILLRVILFITVLTYLGVPMTSVIAILGSFGLALGLALQGGLSNIAGGILILIFKPFKVGDTIDTHTDTGAVQSINIFYTVLQTQDNRLINLPNGPLSNTSIINLSTINKKKVDLKLIVDYKNDIEKVKSVINDVLDKEKLIKGEERTVRLGENSLYGLVFYVQCWVKPEDYNNTNYNLNENIKLAFDKNKIEIPSITNKK